MSARSLSTALNSGAELLKTAWLMLLNLIMFSHSSQPPALICRSSVVLFPSSVTLLIDGLLVREL